MFGGLIAIWFLELIFSFLLKTFFKIEPNKRLIYSLILSYILLVWVLYNGDDTWMKTPKTSWWFEPLISTIGMWFALYRDYEKESVEWRSKGK